MGEMQMMGSKMKSGLDLSQVESSLALEEHEQKARWRCYFGVSASEV